MRKVVDQTIKNICELIERGETSAEGRLPSERELALRLCVSRATVRDALAELRSRGVIQTRRGAAGGNFVQRESDHWADMGKISVVTSAEHIIEKGVGEQTSLAHATTADGTPVATAVLHVGYETCPFDVAELFGYGGSKRMLVVRRLRHVGFDPVGFEVGFLEPRRFPRLARKNLTGSMLDLLRSEYGVDYAGSHELIEVVPAQGEVASRLALEEGEPVLHVTYRMLDGEDRTIMVSRDYYRTDRVRFNVWPHTKE